MPNDWTPHLPMVMHPVEYEAVRCLEHRWGEPRPMWGFARVRPCELCGAGKVEAA